MFEAIGLSVGFAVLYIGTLIVGYKIGEILM